MISKMLKTAIVAVTMCCFAMPIITGCSPSESQMKVIAQQAGLFAAASWIAVDNPDPETKEAVKQVVTLIAENAGSVEEGKTYSEVLYPVVDVYITKNIAANKQPLARAGAVAILGSIDMLFAANPEWAQNQSTAVAIVQAFCTGAKSGLAMSASDPVIKAAVRSAGLRAGLKLNR
jgi:hypothetical protein